MGRMYQVFAVLAKFRNVAESKKNRNFPEASLSPINPNPFYFSLITSEKNIKHCQHLQKCWTCWKWLRHCRYASRVQRI